MQLISISANQKSFKEIKFNEQGPNFILAKQKDPESNDTSKTYNGVGKSLLVAVIHFCLGASQQNKITKEFKKKLKNWVFTLEIKINNTIYQIKRRCNDTNKIYLNNKELSLDNFCNELGDKCFSIPTSISALSFRSLIPFFIRPFKESYVHYDDPKNHTNPIINN